MAKQCGPATFLGTYMDIIGYADDDRALVRMNGVMNKAKWKRHPSFERTREAARYFGAASVIAAGIWKNVPRGLKWIMEGGAYGRLVAACRGLVGKDGNLSDPEGLVGVDLNGWSLPELRDERLEMRVSGAAEFDEGSKMKDESRSLLLGRKRKYVMAEPFTDHEDPDFVVEHERLGTIEAFREGLAELRALEGRPVVRRRRTWVAACEIGSVELVLGHGKKGKFFLEQRGRYWLGKAAYCSEWVVDRCTADFDESGEMAFENLRRQDESYAIREAGVFDERGKMKDESGLGERIREVVREAAASSEGCEKRTGWFVVIVGTEVAEKRGRHWVRLPYCCGVRVADIVCLNQNCASTSRAPLKHTIASNLQNSQDSQDCLWRSEDSQDCSQNGEHAFQDLGIANGDGAAVDLGVDGMAVEFKKVLRDVGVGLPGGGFKILKPSGWVVGEDGLGFGFGGTGSEILPPYCWMGLGP